MNDQLARKTRFLLYVVLAVVQVAALALFLPDWLEYMQSVVWYAQVVGVVNLIGFLLALSSPQIADWYFNCHIRQRRWYD